MFNEKRRECDYISDDQLTVNSSFCPPPKTILRSKPKADGTLMFNGNDVTGKFPTKFSCEQKSQQLMHNDDDWCNIYHLCAGPRDNIFVCPPGTVFNKKKQGCFDRYTQQICSGSINYYKPNFKKPGIIAPPQPPPPQQQAPVVAQLPPASSNVFNTNTNNNNNFEYFYPSNNNMNQNSYNMNKNFN